MDSKLYARLHLAAVRGEEELRNMVILPKKELVVQTPQQHIYLMLVPYPVFTQSRKPI